MRGHKICHPPVKLRVPPWDLPSVLVALGEGHFEPLRQVDMEHLTYKTIFLVALASVRRISELHALSVQPPFLIETPVIQSGGKSCLSTEDLYAGGLGFGH